MFRHCYRVQARELCSWWEIRAVRMLPSMSGGFDRENSSR